MSRKNKKNIRGKQIGKKVKSFYLPESLSWRHIYTSKWFLPLVCVFLLVIIFSLGLISDPDLGFHLRGGQWILENKSFHKNDVFTYTVNHNEYIAMYWLFQVLLYTLFRLSGYSGLVIIKTLFIAFVFLLIFIRMKARGVPLWISTITIFSTVFFMELRFGIRPEIFTWIFLIFMLIVLDQYFYYKKIYLCWLPIIQILWVNFHGLFILGWIVIVAYLISISFHKRKFDETLLKWFAISVSVSILNPYFFKGISFPFYLFTRLQTSNVFKNIISEFISPWAIKTTANAPFFPTIALYLYYLITFVGFILLLITCKKRKVHEYLLLAGFFYISFAAIRNVPLFIIIAIQIIAVSMRDIYAFLKLNLEKIRWIKFLPRYLPAIFIILNLLLYPRIITNAYYTSTRRANSFGLGLDNYAHPVAAADFIVRNNLNGRILNDVNSGSWLIWKIPQPVFIDGRLEVMKEKFFLEYLESFLKGGLQKLINKYKPKMILFDYFTDLGWNIQLKQMPDWRLIYWDETSAIYAHRDYAWGFPAIKFIERTYQMGLDTTISDDEVWAILKTPRKSKIAYWLDGFFKKQNYPYEPMKMGMFAGQNNEFRSAELFFIEFLKRTEGNFYEAYFNLGLHYYINNDYEKALYCYERVLSEQPGNEEANERVVEMKHLLQIP